MLEGVSVSSGVSAFKMLEVDSVDVSVWVCGKGTRGGKSIYMSGEVEDLPHRVVIHTCPHGRGFSLVRGVNASSSQSYSIHRGQTPRISCINGYGSILLD